MGISYNYRHLIQWKYLVAQKKINRQNKNWAKRTKSSSLEPTSTRSSFSPLWFSR